MRQWDRMREAYRRLLQPGRRELEATIGMRVNMWAVTRDVRTGRQVQRRDFHNITTNAGRTSLAMRMATALTVPPVAAGTSAGWLGVVNAVAVGNGTYDANYDATALPGELARVVTEGNSWATAQATMLGFFTSGQANPPGDGIITVIGLLGDLLNPPDVAGTGTLYSYAAAGIYKDANLTLEVGGTWTFTDAGS